MRRVARAGAGLRRRRPPGANRAALGAGALCALALLAPSMAGAACQVGKLAELPVTMSRLSPLVPATIDGTDALFVADSGAFYSLITAATAAQLHLPLRQAPFNLSLNGVGGRADIQLTTVKTFRIAGADIHNIDFIVGGSATGGASVGLIGQNVLGLADVEYDLEHGAIRLMRPHGCERANLAYWAAAQPYSVVRLGWTNGPAKFTVVSVSVNGANLRALLDSGANLSAVSVDAARRAGIRTDGPDVKPAGFASGLGRRMVRSWIAPVKSFKIGDEEIKNTHLRLADLNLGENADMLIGADFLLSHRVYVSNTQNQAYFTYDGGPVFNLETATRQTLDAPPGAAAPVLAPQGAPAAAPADADGFDRRGAAFAARQEYASAVADFSKAIALAPGRADILYRRGLARADLGQLFLAMDDMDAALKLQPQNLQAHVVRAELRLRGRDEAGAKSDIDAASAAAAKEADVRLHLAGLYMRLDAFPDAIGQYDLWIAVHGDDSRLGGALAGRCWARALANTELDRAAGDCRRALPLAADPAQARGALGVIELRRGDLPHAISDFTTALKTAPRDAWWLYGRGVAETRAAQLAQGQADLAAAAALAPRLADHARKLGLPPPA